MTPSISRAEFEGMKARKARARVQPVKAEGELLAVFVEGRLRNFMNSRAHWRTDATYRKRWKERTALVLYENINLREWGQWYLLPKRVVFLANVFNLFDSDGLQSAIKPIRDALVECSIVSGDSDKTGNVFEYHQRVARKCRGVEIRVRLRP